MLGFLWSVFLFFFRAFMAITIFLLYGYVEKLFQSGIFVTIGLGLYLMRYVSLTKALVLLLAHLVGHIYHMPVLVFLTLVSLDLLYFFGGTHDDDALVNLKPHEKEIRQLLLKHNPDALRKVDNLLIKYRGRERDLLKKIQDKYEPGGSELMSPSNNVKHEDVYPEENHTASVVASGGTGSSSGKDGKFVVTNPLGAQVAKQQERSKSIRASGKTSGDDHMINYGKIYDNDEEFETSNPMVEGTESPAQEDDITYYSNALRHRGGGVVGSLDVLSDSGMAREENPMLARNNSLKSNVATPFVTKNSLLSSSSAVRKSKFDQSAVEQAKREEQERMRRLVEDKYGSSQ